MKIESAADVPWWMVGGVASLWLFRELWGAILTRRKDRTETDANITLVEGLATRVRSLEDGYAVLERRVTEEMRLRMEAQETAHRLALEVTTLKSKLKQLGVTFPEGE